MQVVRVVIVRVILVGVLGVTVVHIGHDKVLVVVLKSVAIFVVIFCIWRCTLYKNEPDNNLMLIGVQLTLSVFAMQSGFSTR